MIIKKDKIKEMKDDILNLKNKTMIECSATEKEIFIKTKCGTILSYVIDQGDHFHYFNCKGTFKREERKVKCVDLSFFGNKFRISFEKPGPAFFIKVVGIKEIKNVAISKNRLELKIKCDTYSGYNKHIFYVKDSAKNKWVVSEFFQEIDDNVIDLVKNYNLINHPSVRMLALL